MGRRRWHSWTHCPTSSSSSSTLEGGSSLFDAVGFHLASTDSAAAAVQVMSPAQVWFAPGLGDDEELLAGASTALLMYTRLDVR